MLRPETFRSLVCVVWSKSHQRRSSNWSRQAELVGYANLSKLNTHWLISAKIVISVPAGSFFPGVDVNNRYTQVQQKLSIARYVGNALADRYVTSQQFLARGHLAAKSDFVFATAQRATFYFINCAPQWQPFNAGNWNNLEQVTTALFVQNMLLLPASLKKNRN